MSPVNPKFFRIKAKLMPNSMVRATCGKPFCGWLLISVEAGPVKPVGAAAAIGHGVVDSSFVGYRRPNFGMSTSLH